MLGFTIIVLFAGCLGADGSDGLTVADCLTTYGDNCTCTPQCMTQEQIDAIGDYCDLGCDSEVQWECGVDESGEECVVLE